MLKVAQKIISKEIFNLVKKGDWETNRKSKHRIIILTVILDLISFVKRYDPDRPVTYTSLDYSIEQLEELKEHMATRT